MLPYANVFNTFFGFCFVGQCCMLFYTCHIFNAMLIGPKSREDYWSTVIDPVKTLTCISLGFLTLIAVAGGAIMLVYRGFEAQVLIEKEKEKAEQKQKEEKRTHSETMTFFHDAQKTAFRTMNAKLKQKLDRLQREAFQVQAGLDQSTEIGPCALNAAFNDFLDKSTETNKYFLMRKNHSTKPKSTFVEQANQFEEDARMVDHFEKSLKMVQRELAQLQGNDDNEEQSGATQTGETEKTTEEHTERPNSENKMDNGKRDSEVERESELESIEKDSDSDSNESDEVNVEELVKSSGIAHSEKVFIGHIAAVVENSDAHSVDSISDDFIHV